MMVASFRLDLVQQRWFPPMADSTHVPCNRTEYIGIHHFLFVVMQLNYVSFLPYIIVMLMKETSQPAISYRLPEHNMPYV
jgi:hypothetical protein